MNNSPIGMFDSGVGGLSILEKCRKLLVSERFIYVFDKSHAPYGTKPDQFIIDRAFQTTELLVKKNCKAVVIACNTATNAAIDYLRQEFSVPIIGVVPPIQQAADMVKSGKILVLLTEATARQLKFKTLSESYLPRLVIAPQKDLATVIEQNFQRIDSIKKYVFDILSNYKNISAVVLGCTHYYFIKDIISEYYGTDVPVIEPGDFVAVELQKTLDLNGITGKVNGGTEYIVT